MVTCETKIDTKVLDDRVEQFANLGFTIKEAEKLAAAKTADGNYWRVAKVERMINHPDCDHTLAVELLT